MAVAEPTLHEFVVDTETPERLDLLVARVLDLSRTQAATLIANGNVLVNGKREKASFKSDLNMRVAVSIPAPVGRDITPEDIPLNVAFEDDYLLVIDKPAGMVVHPAPGNWSGTLVNALKGRGDALADSGDPERAGLVHRLDKETSGLLVVAKDDRTHRLLSAALAARKVSRRYAALAWGHLNNPNERVDKPIGRDPKDRTKMAIVASGKAARTDFFRLARFDSCELLRAHLHTGRTHQIRVHLSSIGHPVVGDDTYGGGGGRRLANLPPKRQFLHAAWLRFRHPVSGDIIDLRSDLPPDLAKSLFAMSGMPELEHETMPLQHLGFYRTEGTLDVLPIAGDDGEPAAPSTD
jgi:23S rRNA pseudouridine1911/1915/1917 synthase